MAVTGASVFNLKLISSHSLSPVVSFATHTLVPCPAPLRDSRHSSNALAHPMFAPKTHLKLKLEFCFSWSLVRVLQTKIPKGLTFKLTADDSFIKLLSINLCIFMQRLREDPDCQQFPTVPVRPFSLPSFRFITHDFLLPPLPTAVLLWGDCLPEAVMFTQICTLPVSPEHATWK